MSEIFGIEQFAEQVNTSVNTVRYWRTIGYGPKSAPSVVESFIAVLM